ncbi:MAG: alpha-2-macroglobulin family protein, partial [Alphaproteobacteria bacterium]
GLTAGTGGAAPALAVVGKGNDLSFLSLTGPAFDLSDRGVAGHPPAPPIDVFLTTDRGAYRAGETVNATALARDGRAAALENLPLTAILRRPDGVEMTRTTSNGVGAGGHVFAFALPGNAPRGTWRLDVHADPEAPALASQTLLVEDFLPERLDFDLSLSDPAPRLSAGVTLSVDARYLFGAPAADLAVEGSLRLRPVRALEAWPGYVFGPHDDLPGAAWAGIGPVRTDAAGHAEAQVRFPKIEAPGLPLRAVFTVELREGSGRPVEREIEAPVTGTSPMIGIKPLFDGTLPENAQAEFAVVALDAEGAPLDTEARWQVNRLETRYQWYSVGGGWKWEPTTTRTRVASGKVTLGNTPAAISAPTTWGEYELVISAPGRPPVLASTRFSAGWYASADAATTPDMLEVSLDAPRYAPGDTATLRFVPRAAGKALVTVVSNRLIDMVAVEAREGENTVSLPVTEEWGSGAYVAVTLVRPLAGATGHAPTRALGIAHAAVDPGERRLAVRLDAPGEAEPRGPLEVTLDVAGIAEGERAWATVAAVDVGILNLTSFAAPDPTDHYFGQRRLGMAIRDLYGRLIDGRSGEMGALRSGGDAMAQMRMQAPPPTEELLAQFSGPVEISGGKAVVRFDLPSFNGTVRLMAVVWSKTGVGNASADVLVRDPVVVTASLPRFLAPGDRSRLLLEFTHAAGPAGTMELAVNSDGLLPGAEGMASTVNIAPHETVRLSVPIVAPEVGTHWLKVALLTPDGKRLEKRLTLPVLSLDPEVAETRRISLAPGKSLALSPDLLAGFAPGTGRASVTVGPLARVDAAGLLDLLDAYPYGCTEQQASRALPLLYMADLAETLGLEAAEDIPARIEKAIAAVLANQSSAGSFGLWQPDSGDLWLDAFATDFLARARRAGFDVPDPAFRAALANLRNRVNYYPDFEDGGTDLAYALYVLASEGAAAMGDLRYYADTRAEALATPLAQAQLGAALALYGDPTRAEAMFARAAARLEEPEPEGQFWREDYGTNLRDVAAVLALAEEAGSTAVDREALLTRLAGGTGRLSTQEATWALLAAHAMLGDGAAGVTLDGAALETPVLRFTRPGALASRPVLANASGAPVSLTISTIGKPATPPAPTGNGYTIERRHFTLDGTPADPSEVAQGTRLVTVLTVTPWSDRGARLMVSDPLPAGFEIDNPSLLRAGDISALDWLEVTSEVDNAEYRQDRFLAAVTWASDKPLRLAYIVRAVSPGVFHHPAASVEDMYRRAFRANGAAGTVTVTK